ncbi:MAG: Lrp/AsnC family transcriptional regulator [Desulfurococcaceae archaeon]|nr:Lrp/AsnC family transcriptional regulator [Sulfolobales archaeon]MDW8170347.1 Lrp/AsnC family transcriptional regulator [Desulfurococcaceae archaeon]
MIVDKPLDEVDLRILRALALNARISIRELARELNRSPSTVHERIRKLEKMSIITGFTSLLNYKALGYTINALTLLQVDGASIEELESSLAKEPCVRCVYDITGEYDVAVISSFKSVDELDKFVKRLIGKPYVKRSVTSIILRVVKENPHLENFTKGGHHVSKH